MPIGVPGGTGGGGGGLTLGPPTNTFTAATQALAETARDTYALANADWLAAYDEEATYTIQISWPAVVTDTVYQARRSLAWADITPIIRGPRGAASTVAGPAWHRRHSDGADGADGSGWCCPWCCMVLMVLIPGTPGGCRTNRSSRPRRGWGADIPQ